MKITLAMLAAAASATGLTLDLSTETFLNEDELKDAVNLGSLTAPKTFEELVYIPVELVEYLYSEFESSLDEVYSLLSQMDTHFD